MAWIVEYDKATNIVKKGPYTTGDYDSLKEKDHLVNPDLTKLVEYRTSRLGNNVPITPFKYKVHPKHWKHKDGAIVKMTKKEITQMEATETAERIKQEKTRIKNVLGDPSEKGALMASILVMLDIVNEVKGGSPLTYEQFVALAEKKIDDGLV